MTEDGRTKPNYRILLGQGVATDAANELTSVKLVLPFLYTSVGAPVFFAGLLVPITKAAKIGVQILVAQFVSAARSSKGFIVQSTFATALALVFMSLTLHVVPPAWLVPVFLIVALTLGAASGVGSLAFQALIGRTLPDRERSRLLFTQSSLAGLFTVTVALVSQLVLQPGTSRVAHQELIWLAIGLFVLSALMVMAVREPQAPETPDQHDDAESRSQRLSELREEFQVALAIPWFRRFLIARSLYLSIELAMPFFAIHAASFHGNSVIGLNAFIIASSVGLVVGGVIWPRIGKNSVLVILVLAAAVTCVGGLLALAIEFSLVSQGVFLYAIVFVLVSIGAQGIKNGRTLFLIGATTDQQRPYCIAASNVSIGLIAIIFGAVLGALASFRGVGWPIFALIALNVLAALYTLRLRGNRDETGTMRA